MEQTATHRRNSTSTERNDHSRIPFIGRIASGVQRLRDRVRRFRLEEYDSIREFINGDYFSVPGRTLVAFRNKLAVVGKCFLDGEVTWLGEGRRKLHYNDLPTEEVHRIEEIYVTDDSLRRLTLVIPYALPLNGTREQMRPLIDAQLGDRLLVSEARFADAEERKYMFITDREGRCVVEDLRYIVNTSYKGNNI